MKKIQIFVFLLLFVNFTYVVLLPLNYYMGNRRSFSLLAHISKEFGAQMDLQQIYTIIESRCNSTDLFEGLKNSIDKYNIGKKYFHKAEKSELKLKINKHSHNQDEKKLTSMLTHQTFDSIIDMLLNCKSLSDKFELALQIIKKRFQASNFEVDTKIKNLLDDLSDSMLENGVIYLDNLELKLVKENKVEHAYLKMIIKLGKLIGNFFKKEINKIKSETESLLNNS